ncbi:LacI family DNA-binding transcriptional regulator [Thermobifida fusca]|uniref:LacI family transcription regulator n=2 Tax=Thermobifida fusca TaxID=2021 RepID=A0A9P2WPA5_THEFU|nr:MULTISPECIES: LacI family DNA-binding transcriptional regulator [Thermobifida]AAZ56823.1 transcriptional regulator, LacI family [Thermobifida fusca YX]EOR70125.1 LacI family transcription regulator [Thermobifida fusca TM51]MBO2529883.1 LacI family transcriptional regulator [Thermobifida sp.]PPS92426.1 LacI family transcriptional regulator [Thermobifida fusca]PZN66332.1 MAG: LacI family transcriptional regulator [Thermobifida fusca]
MAETPSRSVTISAIAAEAGVSAPTVSRVLNGRGDVAPETRERIENLLRLRGYRRRGSRGDGQRRGERIGLIDLVFNDLDSPWAVEIIRGVEDAAHGMDSGIAVSAIHRQASSTRKWLQNVRSRASDGAVLVTTDLDSELRSELEELHIPVVVIDPVGLSDLTVPTIGCTNWAGGLSATTHLIELGHRRIGFVAGRPELWCSRARLDGYRAGLETAGIEVDPELIAPGEFNYESGFRAGERLFDLDDPPTAVFAASDQMALGVYEALRQRGLRVPDDVSVVGFDDLPQARWSSPPLTTVRQPLDDMGRLAVRTLRRLMDSEEIESPRVELATELIVRDSTAPSPTATKK